MKLYFLLLLFFSFTHQDTYETNSTQFTFNFYNQLISNNSQANVLFSSYSLRVVLSMLLEGCGGLSANEIEQACLLSSNNGLRQQIMKASIETINQENSNYQLKTVNAIWPQSSESFNLQESYKQIIEQQYFGISKELDYLGSPENSRLTINEWVSNETNKKIQNLLPEGIITSDTRLIITNCLYFKGTWKYQFNPANTYQDTFQVTQGPEGIQTQVNVMKLENTIFPYYEDSQVQVISLPYEGDLVSMLIVLPKLNDNYGKFTDHFVVDNFTNWLQSLSNETVNLYLPRFQFEWTEQLNEVLNNLGVQEIFTGNANLSQINGDTDLYVSDIIQKTFIEVNEEGAEAAAATAAVIQIKAIMENPIKEFKALHPFYFMIIQQEEILFMGKVYEPSQTENNFIMEFTQNLSSLNQIEDFEGLGDSSFKLSDLGARLTVLYAFQFCLLLIIMFFN